MPDAWLRCDVPGIAADIRAEYAGHVGYPGVENMPLGSWARLQGFMMIDAIVQVGGHSDARAIEGVKAVLAAVRSITDPEAEQAYAALTDNWATKPSILQRPKARFDLSRERRS